MNELKFQYLALQWQKKLKVKGQIAFIKDNRMKYSAAIAYSLGLFIFYYNWKNLRKQGKREILECIIHELGHIYYNTYRFKYTVKSEYLAETFCINNLKKYTDYKQTFRWSRQLKDARWCKKFPIHAKAFKKIQEELTDE